MNNDVIIWIMNIVIIIMFVYMLINRTYLETNVVLVTMDGEIVLQDVYAKRFIATETEEFYDSLGERYTMNISMDGLIND